MYFGGYGGCDGFAYICCKNKKATPPDIAIVYA